MTDDKGEKKIIIDEDWKSQIEAEREEAERKRDEGAPADQQEPGPGQMPPASFEMLITTMATEAMISLGQIPHPVSGQPMLNLDHAKYFIDTLEVLQEKTKGNLTSDEEKAITELVHQLKMAFVATQSQPTHSDANKPFKIEE